MHETNHNIDWESCRVGEIELDGEGNELIRQIDLLQAYDLMYPNKRVQGFSTDHKDVEYLKRLEALCPITSPEVAALALAQL